MEPSTELRTEKVPLSLPPSVKVTPIGPGKCLSHMLRDGEIDAIYCATRPSTFDGQIVSHAFPDYVAVEKEYFRTTKIFPIMHIVALRRDVHERHPWLARAVCKAFALSLDKAYDAINERAALRYMLPWLQAHVAETQTALGSDRYWRDGLPDNRHGSSTLLLSADVYSHRQVPQLLIRARPRQEALAARRPVRAVHARLVRAVSCALVPCIVPSSRSLSTRPLGPVSASSTRSRLRVDQLRSPRGSGHGRPPTVPRLCGAQRSRRRSRISASLSARCLHCAGVPESEGLLQSGCGPSQRRAAPAV